MSKAVKPLMHCAAAPSPTLSTYWSYHKPIDNLRAIYLQKKKTEQLLLPKQKNKKKTFGPKCQSIFKSHCVYDGKICIFTSIFYFGFQLATNIRNVQGTFESRNNLSSVNSLVRKVRSRKQTKQSQLRQTENVISLLCNQPSSMRNTTLRWHRFKVSVVIPINIRKNFPCV